MTERLPWQRGDKPLHYVAYPTGNPADGRAMVFYGVYYDGAKMRWQMRIEVGETIFADVLEGKQEAADRASRMWPRAVAQEREEVAAIEDVDDLRTMVQAARFTGGLNLDAFKLATSPAERLYVLMRRGVEEFAQAPAIAPLAAALTLEMQRRREAGETPSLGIYGTRRVAEELNSWPPLPLFRSR